MRRRGVVRWAVAVGAMGAMLVSSPIASPAEAFAGCPPQASICRPEAQTIVAESGGLDPSLIANTAVAAAAPSVVGAQISADDAWHESRLFGSLSLFGWVEGNFNVAPLGPVGLPAADTSQNGWTAPPRHTLSSRYGEVQLEIRITSIETPPNGVPGPVVAKVAYTPLKPFTRSEACYDSPGDSMMLYAAGYGVNLASTGYWWPNVCDPGSSFSPTATVTLTPAAPSGPVMLQLGSGWTYYYPPGHPNRPPDIRADQGVITRALECLDGDGLVTHHELSTPVSIAAAASTPLPEFACPTGSVAMGFGSTWTPTGGTPTTLVKQTPMPPWVGSVPTKHPKCLTQDCFLELHSLAGQATSYCGDFALDCPLWYVDPDRATHYTCQWGPYEVDLSICSVFRDPGRILPNAHVDDTGTTVPDDWPPLALDSNVVPALTEALAQRYPGDEDSACSALGEVTRGIRGDAPVLVPDVVTGCEVFGVLDAIADIEAAAGNQVALSALALAAVFGPVVTESQPDCDRIDPNGACADPTQRTVSIGDTSWVTGPKAWSSPSEQTVVTVQTTCVEAVQAANPGMTAGEAKQKCETQPIFVPGGKPGRGEEAAVHDLDVIQAHPQLVEIEYISEVNKNQDRRWYRYLPPCAGNVAARKTDCDEYPFYTSIEGGRAAYDTYGAEVIRPIDHSDNFAEGIALNMMYQDEECHMLPAPSQAAGGGTRYLVIPVPEIDVPSFYLCPSGGS